jgi:hypothetical protein
MPWKTLKIRLILALSLALSPVLGAEPAAATAGLTCTIDDGNLAFSLFAATNREHGSIVSVTESKLRLKSKTLIKLAPGFSGELKVEQDNIIQQWFLERELRIAINIDNEHGELLLAIIGQGKGPRHSGRYTLKVSREGNSRTVTGRIRGCSGDD